MGQFTQSLEAYEPRDTASGGWRVEEGRGGNRRAAGTVWDQGEQFGGHCGALDARTEQHQAGS